MKRWLALLLSLTLLGTLGVPTLAETEDAADSTDARLAKVTGLVKERLDLDNEHFTSFQGEVSEEALGNIWYLYWSADQEDLNVEALEDGTVVGYWYNDGQSSYYRYDTLPTFPSRNETALKAAARAFLDKVLDPATESVELDEPAAGSLRSTTARFAGTILLNGLPSPLTYSVTVRYSDNTVTNFRRDAPSQSYLGNIPAPTPAVSAEDAAKTLRTTLKLEPIYVEDDTNHAVLRYVPKENGSWAVDARTGELVDTSGTARIYTYNAAAPAEAEEAAADMASGSSKRTLTDVELSGVEKLDGVLDRDALDRAVRAESAYQLGDCTLSYTRYRLIKETDADGNPDAKETVVCSMRYAPPDTGDADVNEDSTNQITRTFEVDARTGEVRSLYSYRNSWDRTTKPSVSLSSARSTASAFLGRFTKNAMELYADGEDIPPTDANLQYSFTFARKQNGYFFPADCCAVTVDALTGAVIGVTYNWHEKITFAAASNPVSAEAAVDAWLATFETTLGYCRLFRELDRANAAESRLIDMGYTSFYSLFLGYTLARPDDSPYLNCPGIDAITGKPAAPDADESNEITYSDIAGAAGEAQIQKLADFGVGYAGGKFRPTRNITQWEFVCLLASLQGWRLNPDEATDDQKNSAYETAYSLGALDRADRKDSAVLTRGALIKMLLDCAGFKSAAALQGIYTTSYDDAASIPAAELGYAAIAQALGLAEGSYNGADPAARSTAAVLLCRIMERAA